MGIPTPTVQFLLDHVNQGQVVVPDFQRSFVWDPDDIKDLLVSIIGGYYVGTLLYMDVVTDEAPFKLRFIEGVDSTKKMPGIVTAILDGQQRTSSLFYALYAPEMPLRGKKGYHRFFLNIPKLLAKDFENSVSYAVSTKKKELDAKIESPDEIGVSQLLRLPEVMQRLMGGPHKERTTEVFAILNAILQFNFHTIELPRGTPLGRVVETFERINRTGRPLSVQDLLVARLFLRAINLRDLISDAKKQRVFADVVGTEPVLRVVCLMRGLDYREKTILQLEPDHFAEDWISACDALDEAIKRMTARQPGYGVFEFKRWAPFNQSLTALAALLILVKARGSNANDYHKVDEWYWATVFGNRYNEGVNTTIPADIEAMKAWLGDDTRIPAFLRDFKVSKVDLDVSTADSAVYRGVMSLVVLAGALDFKTGQPPAFDKARAQDDHVFPQGVYNDHTVTNRTLITTNQDKGAKQPSVYFNALAQLMDEAEMLRVLETHLIPQSALKALLNDDLIAFKAAREGAIRNRIGELLPSRDEARL